MLTLICIPLVLPTNMTSGEIERLLAQVRRRAGGWDVNTSPSLTKPYQASEAQAEATGGRAAGPCVLRPVSSRGRFLRSRWIERFRGGRRSKRGQAGVGRGRAGQPQ